MPHSFDDDDDDADDDTTVDCRAIEDTNVGGRADEKATHVVMVEQILHTSKNVVVLSDCCFMIVCRCCF